MARIRTIKPEFWEHPKVTRVSRDARLLFLGLLNEADDEGKLRFSAKKLGGVLFGSDDDVGAEQITDWTAELEREHLVVRYEVDGAPLLLVCGFTEHQRVSHPSPSRLPNPPEDFASRSREAPESLRPEMEQGTGNREVEEEHVELTLSSAPPTAPDPVCVVFKAWQEATGHHRAILDPKRRRAIDKAMKLGYPVGDLVAAVHGVMLFPHNRGETNGTRYDDLTLVLRDSEHIERFRDRYLGAEPRAAPKMPEGTDMSARWLARQETNGTA